MKDGRTHLAHKAEHAVDLETGAIVGITVQGADQGDTTTIETTLPEAVEQLIAVAVVTDDTVATGEEVVTDKGYHSKRKILELETFGVRTYISEPYRWPTFDRRSVTTAVVTIVPRGADQRVVVSAVHDLKPCTSGLQRLRTSDCERGIR